VTYTPPEPLRGKHDLGDFCCEEDALDNWLHRHSRHAEAAESARTFVTTDGRRVVGFYALAIGQVEPDDATERLLKGQPAKRPIPVLILARLAVDHDHQKKESADRCFKTPCFAAPESPSQLGYAPSWPTQTRQQATSMTNSALKPPPPTPSTEFC
jgi:hypothetical protein